MGYYKQGLVFWGIINIMVAGFSLLSAGISYNQGNLVVTNVVWGVFGLSMLNILIFACLCAALPDDDNKRG